MMNTKSSKSIKGQQYILHENILEEYNGWGSPTVLLGYAPNGSLSPCFLGMPPSLIYFP